MPARLDESGPTLVRLAQIVGHRPHAQAVRAQQTWYRLLWLQVPPAFAAIRQHTAEHRGNVRAESLERNIEEASRIQEVAIAESVLARRDRLVRELGMPHI